MKKVYLVLTHTGTLLSNIIKLYTRNEFSHVSIALDAELKRLYSFGRLNPYNAFKGGFVHEGINKGTFKRFKNTKTAVYSLEVSDRQYNKIEQIIEMLESEKQLYTFNIIGLLLVAINKRVKRENSFYCAEFVKYVLESAEIELDLPKLIKPEDFKNLKQLKLLYKGYLRIYKYNDTWNKIKIIQDMLPTRAINSN